MWTRGTRTGLGLGGAARILDSGIVAQIPSGEPPRLLTVKNPGSQSTEGLGSQWLTSRDSSSPGREHRTGPVCLGDCKEGGEPLEELRLRGV